MPKYLAFFGLFILLILTSCASGSNRKFFTEKDNINVDNSEQGFIFDSRLNELKNGRQPVVKKESKPSPKISPTDAVGLQSQPAPDHSQTKSSDQIKQNSMPAFSNWFEQFKHALIKTNYGDIKVELYGDESPVTVNNFLDLAKNGFYDGTRFHRIIPDFMIQGGDPLSKDETKKALWGTGGTDYRYPDEINNKPLVRGSLAMANSGPDTNGSQFFIVIKEFTPWLDGKHTNFGFVIEGQEVVEKISAVQTGEADRPLTEVVINGIELLE